MTPKNNQQLFMLHFAGGNRYSFHFLKSYLPANVDFHPLELPGRGKRFNETLLLTESEAVEDVFKQITSLRDNQKYTIFGHSLGASMGLRVTKKLEELGDPPERLIVGGNAGPGIGENTFRSTMNDEELKKELGLMGGVPDEILKSADLFDFFAPILRADFKLYESSDKLDPDFMINTPITAVMGDQEKPSNEIENWRKFTKGEFKSYILSGNHFFIYDHPAALLQIIENNYDRPLVF